jgi:hypothetical protein
MERIVPRTTGLRGVGRGERSSLTGIAEGDRVGQQFDGIDWSAAAPSWASLITGLALPFLAVVALVIVIDFVLCWSFQSLIPDYWSVTPWLLSIVVFPLALICAFSCGKLFLYLKRPLQDR